MNQEFLVVTFPSTYYALKAEKALKAIGYDIPLTPIPRELTSNCGHVLRIQPEKRDEIASILVGAGVLIEEVHTIKPREKKGLLDHFFGF